MKVQIIAHNGKGRGSRIIKWATRGRFSHISVRFIFESKEELDRARALFGIMFTMDHEIESIQGKGVHHQPFTPSDNQAWFEFDQTPTQAFMILGFMTDKIGAKYDWRGIGGFLTRRNKQNPLYWFCSEIASAGLLDADITALHMPPHWQSPNVFVASPIFTEIRSPIE